MLGYIDSKSHDVTDGSKKAVDMRFLPNFMFFLAVTPSHNGKPSIELIVCLESLDFITSQF